MFRKQIRKGLQDIALPMFLFTVVGFWGAGVVYVFVFDMTPKAQTTTTTTK